MVRPELVRRKLQLIAEDLGRLLRFKDIALEELIADDVLLAAVERLLERIVMRAIDVNEHLITELATGQEEQITRLTYRDTFLRLSDLSAYPAAFAASICQSAGLRNILVHDYNDVDHRILHASIRTCLQDYHRYVEHVSAFVARFDEAQ